MTLLDVGCGWGATMMRAAQKYDVNVVGLTLSRNQARHVEQLFANSESTRAKRVLLQGWEQFDEPVDRIVSIGAFEHFGHERYDAFFTLAHRLLPDDGIMLLHTITGLHPKEMPNAACPCRSRSRGSSNSLSPRSFRAAGCRRYRWCTSVPPRTASP